MEVILASSLDSIGGIAQFVIGLAIAGGVIFIIVKYKDKGIISGWLKRQSGDRD